MSVKVSILLFVLLLTLCGAHPWLTYEMIKQSEKQWSRQHSPTEPELPTEQESTTQQELPTQQEIPTQQESKSCVVAEEQVAKLKEYIDIRLKEHLKEIANLISKKEKAETSSSRGSDRNLPQDNSHIVLWGK